MTHALIVFFTATLGSIVLGMCSRKVMLGRLRMEEPAVYHISKLMKYSAVFFTEPLPLINAFWTIELVSARLLLMVGFSLVYAAVSMTAAVTAAKRSGYDPSTSASYFVSVSFSNFFTFGGLAALLLFGQQGYALVMLAVVFTPLVNYGYGYIISHNIARGYKRPFRFSLTAFRRSLIILVPISSIIIGLFLRLTPAEHPPVLNRITDVLVPLQAALFGFSFGLTLRVSRVRKYARVLASILVVKYLIVPVFVLPVFLIAGLYAPMDGMPIFIILLLLFMPVAINALVPPVLYGFDLDLVNSAWLITTAALLLIFPVFLFLMH